MTTPFLQLLGAQADRAFQSLGINLNLLRYQGAVIDPPPPVWHYGLQGTVEDSSGIQGSEPLHTYKSPIPNDSLVLALGTKLMAVQEALDAQLGDGDITQEEYDLALANAQALYTVSAALTPYSIWEISRDRGTTWFEVYLKGEPDFHDFVRYYCVFVKAGIGP